jgi:hypothetical protein
MRVDRAPFDGWAADTADPGQYKDYYYPNAQNARTIWYHVSILTLHNTQPPSICYNPFFSASYPLPKLTFNRTTPSLQPVNTPTMANPASTSSLTPRSEPWACQTATMILHLVWMLKSITQMDLSTMTLVTMQGSGEISFRLTGSHGHTTKSNRANTGYDF